MRKKAQTIKSPAALKKDLDAVFSKYIRNFYADPDGIVTCYTCGVRKTIKTIQAGHFVSRSYLATRWDENNVRPQCWGCNGYGLGKVLDFEENLIKEIGLDAVLALKAKRHQITKLSRDDYLRMIDKYTKLLDIPL